MSYAPPYEPTTSFADDESNQASGRSTVRTTSLDVELANIAASINETIANQKKIARDDDKLRDLLVEPYALSEQTRAMFAAAGRTPQGAWAINTDYEVGDLVQRSARAYICQTAHNSGPTFNAGFWLAISGDGSAATSAEAAAASASAAATSASTASTAATTASSAATSATASATNAAASALAAQNAADSVASLSPVNLSEDMQAVLASETLEDARDALDVPAATELEDLSPFVSHHGFAYDYSSATTMVYDGSTGDGLHRHFGQIAEGLHGRLHLVYGRSPTHGLTAGQTAWYRYSDDGGAAWSAEAEVIPADATLDQRSLSLCVTPTGRILLLYAAVPADSSTPVVYRLRYSDDNGASWTQGTDIASIGFTYCRAFGRVKLIPGDDAHTYRLAWTPYHRSGSGPITYRVAAWYSEDDGLTWTEGAAIVDDTSGQNECEMVAVNAKVWFAVTRGATGLTLYKTTDAGTTWTSLGIVPGTVSDSWVAPTLDKFEKDGSWFLALAYCNRATDKLQWRVASVAAAISSANAFGSEIDVSTDMENASGYQCPVTKPDGSLYVEGGTAYVEFKEYSGQVYTQVRFARIDLLALVAHGTITHTIATGAITIPGNSLERIVSLETEGAAATDDLDTINGGRWGSVYIFQGPQGTSTRDVTLKNGTGNLDLTGDFRINTLDSRIVLVKTGTKWVEMARTSDHTEASLTIAAGAVTVPSNRYPSLTTVDTEGAGATDDLTTINGGQEGQILVLKIATSTRDVTLKDGTGNLRLAGDLALTHAEDTAMLIKVGSAWHELSRSDNGA